MENNSLPTPGPGLPPTDTPSTTSTSSTTSTPAETAGHVVLTTEQYADLQRQATAGASADPATSAASQPASSGPHKSYLGLLFVVLLLASFVVPGLSILTFPIIVFGALTIFGFFKNATMDQYGQKRNPAVIIFRIVSAIALSILVAFGAIVAFVIFLFSQPGAAGS